MYAGIGLIGGLRLCWFLRLITFLLIFSEKDWDDIKFGVDNEVDFYAVSFVKDAEVVHELKNYLKSNYSRYSLLSNYTAD